MELKAQLDSVKKLRTWLICNRLMSILGKIFFFLNINFYFLNKILKLKKIILVEIVLELKPQLGSAKKLRTWLNYNCLMSILSKIYLLKNINFYYFNIIFKFYKLILVEIVLKLKAQLDSAWKLRIWLSCNRLMLILCKIYLLKNIKLYFFMVI